MHAEDAVADNSSHWKVLKGMRDCLEDLHIELLLALIIKPVDLVEFAALVIPPQQEEVQRVFDLHRHQQAVALQ